MNVYIIYGWPEGSWHGRKLRLALKNAGYHITSSPKNADIIIAHSGGCFLIPNDVQAKVVLMIDLPYWPNKSLLSSTMEKIRIETKNLWWYQKMLFDIYYLFTRPVYWMKMSQNWKNPSFPKNTKIILVRNDEDTYLSPTESQKLASENGWEIKVTSGQHDDLWENPSRYIELIQKNKPIS